MSSAQSIPALVWMWSHVLRPLPSWRVSVTSTVWPGSSWMQQWNKMISLEVRVFRISHIGPGFTSLQHCFQVWAAVVCVCGNTEVRAAVPNLRLGPHKGLTRTQKQVSSSSLWSHYAHYTLCLFWLWMSHSLPQEGLQSSAAELLLLIFAQPPTRVRSRGPRVVMCIIAFEWRRLR